MVIAMAKSMAGAGAHFKALIRSHRHTQRAGASILIVIAIVIVIVSLTRLAPYDDDEDDDGRCGCSAGKHSIEAIVIQELQAMRKLLPLK